MEKRSKAETEKFYRELVTEQEKAGLTIRAFAEKKGIPAGTLSYWRHHLKKRDAVPVLARGSEKASKPAFVPVSVVSSSAVTTASQKPKPSRTAVRTVYEVVLGRDRVLRLPADFDEMRVAALVRAVASC